MRKYSCTDGSCIAEKRSWSLSDKVVDLQRMFHHIVVRDEIDPTIAHAALMGIWEYTLACASFKNNASFFCLPETAVDTLKYFHQMVVQNKLDPQTAHKSC